MDNALHATQAEQELLGLLIEEPTLILQVRDILEPIEFYTEEYRLVYAALVKAFTVYGDTQASRLLSILGESKHLTEDQWVETLKNLTLTRGIKTDLEKYVEIIKEKYDKRNILNVLDKQAQTISSKELPVDDILRSIEAEIFDATKHRDKSEFKSMDELTQEYTTEISSPQPTSNIRPGWGPLEKLIPSFVPGQFVIIAARPSMGKTAFALELARNMAKENNVAFYSIEMSDRQILERLLASESAVHSKIIQNPTQWSGHNKQAITNAIDALKTYNIYVDSSPYSKLGEITHKSRILKEKGKLDVILIDYLGLITHEVNGRRLEPKAAEVSEISRQLKSLARELEVPVIALSQLNRSVEARENKRPMMSDLRDSGSLEQDADIIMFLYRDQYYQKTNGGSINNLQPQDLEIDVAKNRNGATGVATLKFKMEIGRIYENATIKKEED